MKRKLQKLNTAHKMLNVILTMQYAAENILLNACI